MKVTVSPPVNKKITFQSANTSIGNTDYYVTIATTQSKRAVVKDEIEYQGR